MNHLWAKFEFYELDEIMRQQGERDFCEALNNMSEGVMTEKDEALMRTRQICDTVRPHPESVRLYLTNGECESFNKTYQESLGTEGVDSIAFDVVTGNYELRRYLFL